MFKNFSKFNDFAILILRVGIGLSFMINHGWKKISGGIEVWEKLGSAMQNFGINFYPVFWGFMASFAEFFGALFLIFGIFTRPSAFLLSFTMLVASVGHFSKGQAFNYPLELFFIFVALIFIGAGKYSIDEKLKL